MFIICAPETSLLFHYRPFRTDVISTRNVADIRHNYRRRIRSGFRHGALMDCVKITRFIASIKVFKV